MIQKSLEMRLECPSVALLQPWESMRGTPEHCTATREHPNQQRVQNGFHIPQQTTTLYASESPPLCAEDRSTVAVHRHVQSVIARPKEPPLPSLLLATPLQHLSHHEVIHILVSPVTEMAGNAGQQTDIEHPFLNAVVHPPIRVESTHFALLALKLARPRCPRPIIVPLVGRMRPR